MLYFNWYVNTVQVKKWFKYQHVKSIPCVKEKISNPDVL